MLQKTKGIVLNSIKFGEKGLVTTIYTELLGRKSFLVQGVFSQRPRFHPSFFQPFTLLDIQVDQKPTRELQRIKEAVLIQPFQTIPFDVSKRAITLFLTEILSKTIKEEEANQVLFQYLYTCIELLDLNNSAIANFHLVFLVNYSKYLGFYPVDNYSDVNCLFDVVNGKFNQKVIQQERTDKGISFLIHKLLNVNFHDMETLQLDHQKRMVLMKVIIDYYNLHLGRIGEIKSLAVLQSLFE